MAKEISTEEFDNMLLDKLEEMTKTELTSFICEHAYEEISELLNNEILSDWETEQTNDNEQYTALCNEFDKHIKPTIIAEYGEDDYVAINKGWSNWTDALCKDGRLTEGQYNDWDYDG